jgi:hypothetical protein
LSSDNSSNSTDAGAIAGATVGAVVGIAAVAAVCWYILRRRKNSNKRQSNLPHNEEAGRMYPHHHDYKAELSSEQAAHEMEQQNKPLEMDNGIVSELEGSWGNDRNRVIR